MKESIIDLSQGTDALHALEERASRILGGSDSEINGLLSAISVLKRQPETAALAHEMDYLSQMAGHRLRGRVANNAYFGIRTSGNNSIGSVDGFISDVLGGNTNG